MKKNGRWKLLEEDCNLWGCKCGCQWQFTAGDPHDNEANFCPKCGACMIGDGWRDVQKELPDVVGSYIVFNETSNGCKEVGWAFFNSMKQWASNCGFYENVTHWRPLPDPPAFV